MLRPTLVRAAFVLGCLSPFVGCANGTPLPEGAGTDTVEPDGGDNAGSSAGGTSSAGTSSSSGSTSTGGTSSSAGSTSAGGTASLGGTHAGGSSGTSSAGTSAGGTHTGGTTSSSGSGGTSSAGTSSGGSSVAGTSNGGTSAAGTTGTAGSGNGAVAFSDDFEDGSTSQFVTQGGTWAIVTDDTKDYAQTATGTGSTVLLSAAGSTSWTDQIVEAKVKITDFPGSSTSYFVALYARFTAPASSNNFYSVLLRSDGAIVIRHGNSSIGSSVKVGITTGTWYTVRLECVGSSIKAYLNGTLESSVTDSSVTSGGIALAMENATAEFDDVTVTTP